MEVNLTRKEIEYLRDDLLQPELERAADYDDEELANFVDKLMDKLWKALEK